MKTRLVGGRIRLTFLLSLLVLYTNAQKVDWAIRGGSYEVDYGYGVCNDPEGNIYLTGQFEGTTAWSPTRSTTTKGLHDAFIAKYSPDKQLVWVTPAGGLGGDASKGVALDKLGNVYIVGECDVLSKPGGRMDFGNGVSITNYGINDIFIAKYDPNGNALWARNGGGGWNDKGRAIAVDGAGNAYITGEVESESYFKDSRGIQFTIKNGDLPSDKPAKKEIFVAKYNTNGDIMWAKNFGNDSLSDEARGIACDRAGNCYVTGYFKGTAKFGPYYLTSNGSEDIAIWKLNTNGDVIWVKQAGGPYGDIGRAMTIDEKNNTIYLTGEYTWRATFGSPGNSKMIQSDGKTDVFCASYSTSGNFLWVQTGGGGHNDIGRGIAIDKYSNIFITGVYGGPADFGNINLAAVDTFGADIFTVSYKSNGDVRWAQKAGGDSLDEGHAVSVDNMGKIYVTGYFNHSTKFGTETLISMDHNEIFLACYSEALASKPNGNSSAFSASASGSCGQMNLSWTPGVGIKRLIIARAGADVNKTPKDGLEYSANTAFGMGDALGDGNYVVYNGTGNSVALTNVGAGIQYFKIYEYNGSDFSTSYLLSGNASANASGNGLNMTVSTLEAKICIGGSVIITASGADNYSWSPGDGLNVTSGASVNAKPNTTRTYTVKGTKNGCEKSMNVTVKVENCSSIKDNLTIHNLNIFPNPGNGIFQVKANILGKVNINLEVVNTLGEIVLRQPISSTDNATSQTINLNYLPNGIYLCRITAGEDQQIQKLVIQK